MPEKPRSLLWRQAALRLEAKLRELAQQAPERLDEGTIRSCYPSRKWVAAWRISVMFSDGAARRIDIVATAGFPTTPVRTALVDHPGFMTWPHVESDGILCLLPNTAECDPDDPSDVAANLLHRSVRLVEELLEGSIIDRDFREEFLTYWAYKAHAPRRSVGQSSGSCAALTQGLPLARRGNGGCGRGRGIAHQVGPVADLAIVSKQTPRMRSSSGWGSPCFLHPIPRSGPICGRSQGPSATMQCGCWRPLRATNPTSLSRSWEHWDVVVPA
jgi:hypothetical protein